MTATESATRLHQAAAKLRALLAAIATESPADLAAYITAMGPLAGEPLAAWLTQAAQNIGHYETAAARIWDLNDPTGLSDAENFLEQRLKRVAHALAVADAILGEATP